MKFSVLKDDITPHIPVYLCGFAARIDKRSEGIHDAPYATVVILQENKTVVIITFDLIGGDRSFANGIKNAINLRFGLTEDEIILNFSHTHSVVAITGDDDTRDGYSFNTYRQLKDSEIDYTEDLKYYCAVKTKILNMIEKGLENLIEGNAYVIKGKSMFGVSRRYPDPNGAMWKPYFNEDSMDPDLYLIKLVDDSGQIRSLLYNYACHATTMNSSNYLISADYPGEVRKVLEEQNPGMTAVFLQGCGADVKPVVSTENGEFKQCSFKELEDAGYLFATEIQDLLKKPEGDGSESYWRKIDFNIQTKCSCLKLYSEIWSREKWLDIADNSDTPEYIKKHATKMASEIEEGNIKYNIPYYISCLRLDEKTYIIALENEVVNEIGKDIKIIFSDQNIIVLGYSNSVGPYIPTKKVMAGGGYESQSFMSAALSGQFVDEVEDIIIGRISMMIGG